MNEEESSSSGTPAGGEVGLIQLAGMSLPEVHFVADHPFIFAIISLSNNDIYFLGHITHFWFAHSAIQTQKIIITVASGRNLIYIIQKYPKPNKVKNAVKVT